VSSARQPRRWCRPLGSRLSCGGHQAVNSVVSTARHQLGGVGRSAVNSVVPTVQRPTWLCPLGSHVDSVGHLVVNSVSSARRPSRWCRPFSAQVDRADHPMFNSSWRRSASNSHRPLGGYLIRVDHQTSNSIAPSAQRPVQPCRSPNAQVGGASAGRPTRSCRPLGAQLDRADHPTGDRWVRILPTRLPTCATCGESDECRRSSPFCILRHVLRQASCADRLAPACCGIVRELAPAAPHRAAIHRWLSVPATAAGSPNHASASAAPAQLRPPNCGHPTAAT
jgi:hypothetical protein